MCKITMDVSFTFVETTEVRIAPLGLKAYIKHDDFVFVDGLQFLKLNVRDRQVAQLLLAACTPSKRLHEQAFGKDGPGKKLLKDLKARRDTALRTKYRVPAKRIFSRKKRERADQMATDVISVPLPTLDDKNLGISVSMKISGKRRNGNEANFVRFDAHVLKYLACAMRAYMQGQRPLRIADDDAEDGDNDSGDDGPDAEMENSAESDIDGGDGEPADGDAVSGDGDGDTLHASGESAGSVSDPARVPSGESAGSVSDHAPVPARVPEQRPHTDGTAKNRLFAMLSRNATS